MVCRSFNLPSHLLILCLVIAGFAIVSQTIAFGGITTANPVFNAVQDNAIQDDANLRWRFEKDQVFEFDFSQTTNIATMVAENPKTKNRSTEQRMIVQWKVLSVDSGIAEVEMTYKQVDFTIENDGRASASTDASVPTVGNGPILRLAKEMVKSVKPMLDQPILLKVDSFGKILSLQIEKSVVDAILSAPNTMSLRSNLTKEGIESILSSFLTPLPEDGRESWERVTTTEFNEVPFTSKTIYEVKPSLDNNNERVEIGFETEISFPEEKTLPPENPSQQKNQELKKYAAPFNFDPVSEKLPRITRQESGGTIQFDPEKGMASGADSLMILVTEKSQSNFIIRTTIETKTIVKITRTNAN